MRKELILYSLYDCDIQHSWSSMRPRYDTLSHHKMNEMIKIILKETYPEEIKDLNLNLDHDDLVDLVDSQDIDYLFLQKRLLRPALADVDNLDVMDVIDITN